MKLFSLKMMMLAMILGLAVGYIKTTPTSNVVTTTGTGYMQADFLGATITGNGYAEIICGDAAGFRAIDAVVKEVSAGSITTANIDWLIGKGSVLTTTTLTLGTDVTNFKSGTFRIRAYNKEATPVTVTMSVLVTN